MAAEWFDGIEFEVHVAFTTAPLSSSPSWTEITDYVRDIPQVFAGRQSEFDQYSPRSLQLVLSNLDRRFDPEYAAGPYYGDLLPMKRVRVRVIYDSVTYPLFDGFVLGWPMSFRASGIDSLVTVTAVDGSRILENSTLNRSAYEAAVLADGPIHYWPLQEQNTTASAQYVDVVTGRVLLFDPSTTDLPANLAPTPVEVPTIETIPQIVDPLAASAVGLPRTYDGFGGYINPVVRTSDPIDAEPYGFECWFENQNPDDSSGGGLFVEYLSGGDRSRISFSIAEASMRVTLSNVTDDVSLNNGDLDRSPNIGYQHLAAWYDGADIHVYINGVEVYSETPSGSAFSGSSGYGAYFTACGVAHVAVYGDGTEPDWAAHYLAGVTAFGHPYGERSGARIGRVLDEIGWPDDLRDLETGDTVHGPYLPDRVSAMQYIRDVETAENGLVFFSADGKVTLRDRNWQWFKRMALTDGSGNILTGGDGSPLWSDDDPVFSDDGTELVWDDIVVDGNTVAALRNRVSVSYRGSDAYLFVADQTSIDNFGRADDSLSAPTLDSTTTARGLADYRLRASKDPRTRITRLDVKPRADVAGLIPAVLGLELGDVLTVSLTPVGVGDPLTKELAVQGIEHSISHTGEWFTSLYCAPAETAAIDAPYLLVGDATYGQIGSTAGNQIPF